MANMLPYPTMSDVEEVGNGYAELAAEGFDIDFPVRPGTAQTAEDRAINDGLSWLQLLTTADAGRHK